MLASISMHGDYHISTFAFLVICRKVAMLQAEWVFDLMIDRGGVVAVKSVISPSFV